ncbi:MAG: twin-arginine translocase TatA/TatE family subunit [Spirochaetales bacterium]|nr:twin-arginine translocase TatA/TatE family subunit [Spirochaetales bacterium]
MIGTTEILIIVGVVVLLFGATAIPKLARSIGKARAEFEKGVKEGKEGSQDSDANDSKEVAAKGRGGRLAGRKQGNGQA